jgi:DNA-binding NarL/FixJ family response regulator
VISIISDRDLNSNINYEFYIRINDTKDEIIETLLRAISELNNNNSSRANNVLSSREIDIIRYIAKGMSSKQIADTLYISLNTVNTHRKNISTKIGIKTASGQTAYAILNNIISIEDSTPNFPHH